MVPGTGRGMGYCGGFDAPGWANAGPGRGFYGRGMPLGQGRGRGPGRPRGWGGMPRGRWGGMAAGRGPGGMRWRHWYNATGLPRWARQGAVPPWAYDAEYDAQQPAPSREQEVEMLKDEAAWLKDHLDAIQARMDELSQE